jgi:hypothetical protein
MNRDSIKLENYVRIEDNHPLESCDNKLRKFASNHFNEMIINPMYEVLIEVKDKFNSEIKVGLLEMDDFEVVESFYNNPYLCESFNKRENISYEFILDIDNLIIPTTQEYNHKKLIISSNCNNPCLAFAKCMRWMNKGDTMLLNLDIYRYPDLANDLIRIISNLFSQYRVITPMMSEYGQSYVVAESYKNTHKIIDNEIDKIIAYLLHASFQQSADNTLNLNGLILKPNDSDNKNQFIKKLILSNMQKHEKNKSSNISKRYSKWHNKTVFPLTSTSRVRD